MRTYCIDDLTTEDSAAVRARLNEMDLGGGMNGLYWLPVPQHHLTPVQVAHGESCGPFCLALEVDETALRMELLVRARGMLRCECIAYASPELRAHMIDYLDGLLADLGIAV
ncbi:hypothetical protein [Nitratidesulfovibrio liaohensis]|uniref:Uncharacterized protein n=1 Tax=Nitratidesulfovibrio liaohensis TaxID=2604158 RepID=A0ABY9R572_9BACT|nr:hypothetical protein [Nitratidesulfovibrio liaohensis]WMW65879.1 hypothetical protein KPS_000397 [Nitratidesulfovibrio liaohensis]